MSPVNTMPVPTIVLSGDTTKFRCVGADGEWQVIADVFVDDSHLSGPLKRQSPLSRPPLIGWLVRILLDRTR